MQSRILLDLISSAQIDRLIGEMLDKDVLSSVAGEYESKRSKHKLGVAQMFIVFVKSTIGLAIFGYHEVYQKSGVWLGLFISAVFIYTVTHGCMRMVVFADEVETRVRRDAPEYRVDSYFGKLAVTRISGNELRRDLPEVRNLPRSHDLLPRLLLDNWLHAIDDHCVRQVALCLTSNLKELLDLNPLITRLIILAIVVLGLALMIEPEKLLYLSYFTAVLVVGLGTVV